MRKDCVSSFDKAEADTRKSSGPKYARDRDSTSAQATESYAAGMQPSKDFVKSQHGLHMYR